ncbi:hypothetical protein AALP_AA8G052900 [Arabis alpina]|uniref:Eukaryotic translation initiation factor 3 subunit G n=1 Tax=Arabis alpina TaxID=50452 RepID=A0A087G544_ARAAL|nr:hypothetical protein AALP_AA8G052900 [Arabis alpina]
MAIDSMQRSENFRWGDMEEEDDLDFLLPGKQVIGPDENGVKKVIEYKFNDEGKKVKFTTTIRVEKRTLNKRAVERRSWDTFGDAADEKGAIGLTMRSTEEIHLERVRPPGSKAEEAKPSEDKPGSVLMVCRLCLKKGDHWTARCPQKDLLSSMDNPSTAETSTPTGPINDAYVPPGKRSGAERMRRNDENSVRVNNLSEDTREPDLRELFEPFGAVTRAYVAIDKTTNMSRGFGFVNFVSREDAQRAINKLDGYGYDNLILRVEWAPTRTS